MKEINIVHLEVFSSDIKQGDIILNQWLEPEYLVESHRVVPKSKWEKEDKIEVSAVLYGTNEYSHFRFGVNAVHRVKRVTYNG